MAAVCYSCPFVPVELIAACGHTPRRPEPAPRPASAEAETEGLCAWAAAFVESLAQQTDPAAAAVFTTACDQMRRAYELYRRRCDRPAFLLNVPKTAGPTALAMLGDEYQRLARFLAALDGSRNGQDNLSGCFQTPQIQNPASAENGLAVVGGPLFDADLDNLRQTLRRFGQTIVFDGTESAWRNYRTPCNQTKLNTAPMEALAQRYLSTPAVWKRPAAPFFDWLDAQLKTHHVKGVIIIQHPFCDYWRAAVYDIRSRLNSPVVTLESGQGARFSAAALSRLEAFLEQFER
jgi:benzoyl-CoA reductase/2-hydroxyglutaryl-CoA dehydratase subunit BcrC/BadD/HgdB